MYDCIDSERTPEGFIIRCMCYFISRFKTVGNGLVFPQVRFIYISKGYSKDTRFFPRRDFLPPFIMDSTLSLLYNFPDLHLLHYL